jgi:hypothetical protein
MPLIVTSDKRILDGNRRYFACLYLYRSIEDKDEREVLESVPVWVLPTGISSDDEERILTELNSINDCYEKWPYSVVARRVYRDFLAGMTVEALRRKYHDWTEGRLNTVIEASKTAQEFIEYHGDLAEAKDKAYRKLIWFDELRRSNRNALNKESFRSTIFDLILSPSSPFTSSADFKRLGEIYDNPEAWEVLTTRGGKEALKQALFIVDRERYEGKGDAQSKLKRVNRLLAEILKGPGFGLVDPELLASFHELAEQVPGVPMDAASRAEHLTEMLNGLTSREIAQLPKGVLKKLDAVLTRVQKQAAAHRE